MKHLTLPQQSFLLFLSVVTLAFAWILLPFSGAVFWGVVLGIVFAPMHRRIVSAVGDRPGIAALMSVAAVTILVLTPMLLLTGMLLDQSIALIKLINSERIDFNAVFNQAISALPQSARFHTRAA